MTTTTATRPTGLLGSATPAAVVALEEAVVGVALVEPAAVVGHCSPDLLTGTRRAVLSVVTLLLAEGKPCDPVSVDAVMHYGGWPDGRLAVDLARWVGLRPAHVSVGWYVALLEEQHRRRLVEDLGVRVLQAAGSPDLDVLLERVAATVAALRERGR